MGEQHPVHSVTERARLLSKVPAEVSNNPLNLLFEFNGNITSLGLDPQYPHALHTSQGELTWEPPGGLFFDFDLPPGRRLVIDNIFKDSKQEPEGLDCPRLQLHVYENSEGYLIADKIVDGRIIKKRLISLRETDQGLVIDRVGESGRAMDYPGEGPLFGDRKQKAPTWSQAPSESDPIQLMQTTALWTYPGQPGRYAAAVITLRTPDDTGRHIEVSILNGSWAPEFPEPMSFRLVEDTAEIAPPEYQ